MGLDKTAIEELVEMLDERQFCREQIEGFSDQASTHVRGMDSLTKAQQWDWRKYEDTYHSKEGQIIDWLDKHTDDLKAVLAKLVGSEEA